MDALGPRFSLHDGNLMKWDYFGQTTRCSLVGLCLLRTWAPWVSQAWSSFQSCRTPTSFNFPWALRQVSCHGRNTITWPLEVNVSEVCPGASLAIILLFLCKKREHNFSIDLCKSFFADGLLGVVNEFDVKIKNKKKLKLQMSYNSNGISSPCMGKAEGEANP